MSRSGRRRRRVPTRELLIKETKSREMGLGSPTVATVVSDVSDGITAGEHSYQASTDTFILQRTSTILNIIHTVLPICSQTRLYRTRV